MIARVRGWHTCRHWDSRHWTHTRHRWGQQGRHTISHVCVRAISGQESRLRRDEWPGVAPSGIGQVGGRQGQLQQQAAQIVCRITDLPRLLLHHYYREALAA